MTGRFAKNAVHLQCLHRAPRPKPTYSEDGRKGLADGARFGQAVRTHADTELAMPGPAAMSKKLKLVGFLVLASLSAYTVLFGLLYATRVEMMPHHDAVLPDEITAQVLPLYFALMRLAGAAITVLGLICLYVVFGPMRAGRKGAASVVAVCLVSLFAATAATAARLEAVSGTPTHWQIMAALAAMAIIGFACVRLGVESAGQ